MGAKGDPWWGSVVETQRQNKDNAWKCLIARVSFSSLCPNQGKRRERRRPAIASGESPPTSTKHSPNAETKKVSMLYPAGRVQQCSKEVQGILSHGKEGLAGGYHTHVHNGYLSSPLQRSDKHHIFTSPPPLTVSRPRLTRPPHGSAENVCCSGAVLSMNFSVSWGHMFLNAALSSASLFVSTSLVSFSL